MAVLVDSYSESNQNGFSNKRSGSDEDAQSFTAIDGKLGSCIFYVKRNGSPTGNMFAKLYNHTGTFGTSSTPTGGVIATSIGIDIAPLSTSFVLLEFFFIGINRYTLVNATKYCIVVEYDGGDINNSLHVGIDTTSPTHGGNRAYYDGSWNAVGAQDICFYVYLAVPSGGFFIFLSEAYQKGKKYFEKKNGLYLPKPGILIPEGI